MQKLSVEVFEDPGRPGGGHAVIRLKGLTQVPDVITYRIKPVESAHDAASSWPEGERRPIATRVTREGVELVVGPELVENPLFLPGTLAMIEIPQCGARGEVLWPRIAPLARPRKRHVVQARNARPAPPPEPAAGEPVAASPGAVVAPTTSVVVPFPPSAIKAEAAALSPPLDVPIVDAVPPMAAAAAAAAADDVARPGPELAPAALSAKSSPAAAATAQTVNPLRGGGFDWVGVPARRAWRRYPGRVAAVVATVAVVVGAAASLSARLGSGQNDASVSGSPSAGARGRASLLADLAAVGTTSPRGAQTRDTSPPQLLERADALLNGNESAGDRQEAAWFLRRYIARSLSEERTLWALTQLGSILAEPGNGRTPDYAQARQLWELAGGLGDPVAMCFLGTLHENGLGVREDRAMALDWFRRARHAGGCPGIDDAIARTSRK